MKFKVSLNIVAIILIAAISMQYFWVSLNTPIVFGDEGFYASTSRWIADNGILPKYLPLFQSDISHRPFTNKSFFIMFETFFWMLGGGLGLKILFPIFSVLTAFMIYVFMKKMGNEKAGIVALFIFLFTPSLITYGVMGYVDTLLALLSIMAVYFGYLAFEKSNRLHAVLSGIFIGLALLTKVSGPYLLVLFFAYFLIFRKFSQWKIFALIVVSCLLIVSPWYARNILLFNDVCFKFISEGAGCYRVHDIVIPRTEGLDYIARTAETGTEVGLLRFGMLNYARFAYGWTMIMLFLFGVTFLAVKKVKLSYFLALWLISSFLLIFFSTWRAEDTARYLLPMILPMSLTIGLFVSDVYDWLKRYNFVLAVLLILVIFLSAWPFGQEKINVMYQVKQFVPGFFDGCKWMQQNTPEDSLVLAKYSSRLTYQCYRNVGAYPDSPDLFLSYNDNSYEHMKMHGFDYVFIIEALISQNEYAESYPYKFVGYIENSDKFKLVYDNRNVYGRAGVRIYEVL